MKNYLKSFINKPKKVFIVSLLLAIAIGTFGYFEINQIPTDKFNENSDNIKDTSLGFSANGKVKSILVKVGEKVKRGDILATIEADNIDGSLIQAEAAYEIAKANYQKVINGATGPTVDVAKANVNTAQVNFDQITKQQNVLVNNAYKTLLNSSLQAQNVSDYSAFDSPTVSGTYGCGKEGVYNVEFYSSSGGSSVKYSGLEEGNFLLTDVPRPLGNCGLFLSFDKTKNIQPGAKFYIQIPNKNATNYNANNNAYQLSLQTKDQAIAGSEAVLNQAKVSLESVVANARPEDVQTAEAQVQNAYGILISNPEYNNTIITAPNDGTIKLININEGQIIKSNDPAIIFSGLSS